MLLKDTNAVSPVRLEPTTPGSQVEHSTTDPLRSSYNIFFSRYLGACAHKTCDFSKACYKDVFACINDFSQTSDRPLQTV